MSRLPILWALRVPSPTRVHLLNGIESFALGLKILGFLVFLRQHRRGLSPNTLHSAGAS